MKFSTVLKSNEKPLYSETPDKIVNHFLKSSKNDKDIALKKFIFWSNGLKKKLNYQNNKIYVYNVETAKKILSKKDEEHENSKIDSMINNFNFSERTKNSVKLALETGFNSFSKTKLSDEEQSFIDSHVSGDPKTEKIKPKLLNNVKHPVSVYRAYNDSDIKKDTFISFTLRKDWAENTANDNDLKVMKLNLIVGDKVLFVPFYNNKHIVEVEVLIPSNLVKERN